MLQPRLDSLPLRQESDVSDTKSVSTSHQKENARHKNEEGVERLSLLKFYGDFQCLPNTENYSLISFCRIECKISFGTNNCTSRVHLPQEE
jgi:hypothetical protein